MSTRLEVTLKKHTEHEEGIRLLAERDPSGNLKYLEWGAKMLAAKQALAPEIADVTELFHRFKGQGFGLRAPRGGHTHDSRQARRQSIHPDINTYRPQDLAALRDNLLKIKRATDAKRRKREKLYKIEGEIEADIIYDSDDLIVRHVKNKQASVHYGLNTKWCISMLRERYFEDYETSNATFFFFERKKPLRDELDKVALMVPRNRDSRQETVEVFTTLDERISMFSLVKSFGIRVFDIFKEIYERSARYPGSGMFRVYSGNATREELEAAFTNCIKGTPETIRLTLRAICCNDATPQGVLEEIVRRASTLYISATKESGRFGRPSARRRDLNASELARDVMAAAVIHPNTSDELRAELTKKLRRRRVNIDTICREVRHDKIEVVYDWVGKRHESRRGRYRRHRLRTFTVGELHSRARRFTRMAVNARKKARTLQRKLAEKKRKLAARKKRASKKR